MEIADWVGFFGVSQILLAYFLNTTGKVDTNDLLYKILNFTGATIAFVASCLLRFWPFMILEAIWSLISFKTLVNKK
ncbi:CBU_0592 family membrane protein [Flagellimonas flava]|uniref:CBU-0592-like domain-containing protein n=1 Tax=Flagellimonas flava TaxID=570519 RepID=A0A1M5K0C0_9FLAO|nr:hypothetical protein [Allomuricauda flava]SHG45939.1 hypothetical protein SAMN04488116_1304 [Allomuricauda flava]